MCKKVHCAVFNRFARAVWLGGTSGSDTGRATGANLLSHVEKKQQKQIEKTKSGVQMKITAPDTLLDQALSCSERRVRKGRRKEADCTHI